MNVFVMNNAGTTLVRLLAEAAGSAALQASLVAAALLAIEHLRPRWRPELRGALVALALAKFAVPPWLAWRPALPWSARVDAVTTQSTGATSVAIPLALGAIWALGTLVAFACWLAARIRLARDVAEARPAEDRELLATMSRLARRLELKNAPELFLSAGAAAPWVTGAFRPKLVLPAAWPRALDAEDLERILLHELAHVKRRDVLALDLVSLLAVVWWWNPLFRLAHARWRAILEERCDDRAIAAAGGDSHSYCSSLVRAARLAVDGSGPCATPAGAAGMGVHVLERRLRRVLAEGFAPRGGLAWPQLALIVVLALALLPTIGRPALGPERARHLANHALRHHGHAAGHVHVAELHD